jgi:hypothetical protein
MTLDPLALVHIFFRHLADRRCRENDLSDFTWAICESVPDVARIISESVGAQVSEDSIIRIEREFELGGGYRVDFASFVDKSPTIFVESKIYDRNYHLQQYAAGPSAILS